MRLSLKCIFLLCLMVFSYRSGNAQQSGLQLSGKVIDKATNSPIAFAAVTLATFRDSLLLTGALTDEQGKFILSNVAPGLYKLKIKYIGYSIYVKDSVRINQGSDLMLKPIFLLASGKELTGITVTAEQNAVQLGMDKKVFEVDKDLNSPGGSAVDVLKNIPSLSVDVDGNVTLRGSGSLTVLIDGRPSGMVASNRSSVFEQIPASAIERVELITSPSAKYDPDGISGIINIVLKKNMADGFTLTGSISYATWIKGNASVNAGYRKGKLNVYASYSYRYNQRGYNGYTNRTNELTNSSFSSNQTSGGILTSQTHLAKLGLDYDLNSRNSFSFSGLFNTDLISDTDHVVYSWLDMNQNLTRYSHRDMFGRNTDLGYDLDASYRHLFSKPDHLFTAELSASGNANRAIDSIYQLDYNPNGTFASPYPVLQQTNNNWKYQTAFARADFELPLDHTSKLETGAKVSMRWADDDLQSRSFNYPLGAYANDTGISNRFVYREQVYAAYVIYSQVVGKLNAQLGLRGEDAERSSTLYNTPTVYTHHSLDLFPSGFIGYKSASDAEWRLSYSRRINRPSVRYLNPFPDYTDVLNLRYGNPDLNPEYVDVVELSWMKYLKTGSISASAYYRHTSGVIQIYRSLADTVTGATVSTYRNLSSSDMGGVEVTTRVDLYKWWSLIGNGNVYEVQFVNTDPALPISQTGYAGYLKFSSRINFSSTTSFQFSGTYYFPVPSAQGIMHAYEYLDAGLRQELLHGKASLNLSLADLFNTQQSQITTHASRFTQEYLKKKESRIATITFTYRFGKQGEPKKPKAEELPSAQPEVE